MRTLLVELMYKCPQKRRRRRAGDIVLELCGGDRAEFELRAGTDAAGRYWKEGSS